MTHSTTMNDSGSRETVPATSIVIAARNSWHFLRPCLESLVPGGPQLEVIVVDNGSADGTAQSIAKMFPGVRVVRNDNNVGHCRAINQGMQAAQGEFIATLDADTVASPSCLHRLAEFLHSNPQTVIAAPRMLNPDGSIQPTARCFPRPINGLFGRQSIATRWFPNNRFALRYMPTAQRDTEVPLRVEWVGAACMMFRKALVKEIGDWDEGFFGYWVDADWCKRAGAHGEVACVPDVTVVHYEQNRSGRKKGFNRIVGFHQGAYRFYRKHYTRGVFDPRALLAGIALWTRAALLLAADLWLPDVNDLKAAPNHAEPQATATLDSQKETSVWQ